MGVLFGVLVAAALVVGFLAGFMTFKQSRRWCRTCGAVLRCPECPRRAVRVAPTSTASAAATPGRSR